MTYARKLNTFAPPENLRTEDYLFFSRRMYELSGVSLPDSEKNRALLRNRLSRLLRKYELEGYSDLVRQLQSPSSQLTDDFISSLTTNKTEFFRERSHFDFLKQQLADHFRRFSQLRIWCAAASTGQEPYTLAMVLNEVLPSSDVARSKILATDIDLEALQKGANGAYEKNELFGLPPDLRDKYFQRLQQGYQAQPILSKLISFCPYNLVRDIPDFREPFHFIFCRNVLIYFDQPTINRVNNNLIRSLVPGGYLILGHSESGVMTSGDVSPLPGAVFRRKEKP